VDAPGLKLTHYRSGATCHLVSGEQVEILPDKEQSLQEAYHAAHSAFEETQDRQWPLTRWRLRAD
jgi:hypothetical protein